MDKIETLTNNISHLSLRELEQFLNVINKEIIIKNGQKDKEQLAKEIIRKPIGKKFLQRFKKLNSEIGCKQTHKIILEVEVTQKANWGEDGFSEDYYQVDLKNCQGISFGGSGHWLKAGIESALNEAFQELDIDRLKLEKQVDARNLEIRKLVDEVKELEKEHNLPEFTLWNGILRAQSL